MSFVVRKDPSHQFPYPESGLISTVFTFNNLVAFSVWTLVGDRISLMFRTPESAHRLNMTFGALLAMVGVWMLFS